MDIQYFDFAGDKLPVCFPFESFNELMEDNGFAGYVKIYQSPKFQLKILYSGLKYGHLNEGKPFTMSEKRVHLLGKNNLPTLAKVWRFHDKELVSYMALFQDDEVEEIEEDSLGKQATLDLDI